MTAKGIDFFIGMKKLSTLIRHRNPWPLAVVIFYWLCHSRSFSLLAQRKRTKRKGTPSLVCLRQIPCAPQNGQALRNSSRLGPDSDSPHAFLAVSAVLGYVKWVNSLALFGDKSKQCPLGVDALLKGHTKKNYLYLLKAYDIRSMA